MSLLALILCIIFVFWLLKKERKQNPSASWALWIPTIWIIKVASRDLAYWIGRGGAEADTGSPYERYLLVFLLCLGLIILYKRRLDWYKAIKDNIWLMVVLFYMFASIFWSDIPLKSFTRWIRELIAVIMVLVVLSEDDPRNAAESVLRRSIYILIPFSLLLVMFFPEHGTDTLGSLEAWVGVTNHKNGLGRLSYIAVFFLVWASTTRWLEGDVPSTRYQAYVDILVLGIALYLLKGPGIGKMISVTSVITLAVGMASLFAFLLARKFKRYLGLNTLRAVIIGIVVIGTASVFIGGLYVGGELASSFGREATLTGRTAIWTELLPFVMKEPIIGHGIDGFFTDAMQKSLGNLPHGHNGYLDILLDYGFVGLFLISMFLLSSCGKAYKLMNYDYSWGIFWMSFLIMSLIHDIAEPSLDAFITQPMAIILFLYVSSSANSKYRPTTKNIPTTQTEAQT